MFVLGCSSKDNATGKAAEELVDIYEDDNYTDNATIAEEIAAEETQIVENETITEDESIVENEYEQPQNNSNETLIVDEPQPYNNEEIEEFKFSPESNVSTQNNVSLSLDNLKHEIKSEYWGKIIEITSTILNRGNISFKPKLLVLLYDEKDFKDEWLKPKAEIDFDIEKLNPGEHITRQAIVSISFNDIGLSKNFKLVLVDAADPANKPIVVAEKEFNALLINS